MNYYNDNEPFVCRWLENLIMFGHIPNGIVDCRPIQEITPHDLKGFTQCHFFAGIGGWSFALELAGWATDRPVWTGSCPCQPFSKTGKGKGTQDERHLWPEWYRLISIHKPPVLFGEQVAGASIWLDMVLTDLETCGYACGTANLPACSVGARHERERIWFVADTDEARWQNSKRVPASQTNRNSRTPSGLVRRQSVRHIDGSFEPDQNWIVDGLPGVGDAVSAYGNAIVPQVAAEFIRAYMETL